MGRSYSLKTFKLLWGLAAGRCAFPKCRVELVAQGTGHDSVAVLGEVAHIHSSSDEGPRANPGLAAGERDEYENLILLCAHHHTLVDKQPNSYTAGELRRWKVEHEHWVHERLQSEMPNVGFAELEVVCRAILKSEAPSPDVRSPLAPLEKMDRNGLTDRVRSDLTIGLSKAPEVGAFLGQMEKLDPEFSERLKAGFVEEYRRLKASGIEGDALFEALRDFSAPAGCDFLRQAAGLAVLSYLFEACEVFER